MSSGDGQPDDERIAALEKQLADATAQVAEVRSELHRVSGTQPPPTPPTPVTHVSAVDLSALLGAEQADRVRMALGQLGASNPGAANDLGERLAGMFGPAASYDATPPVLERLAEPPRRVPFAFRLAVFSWSWYEPFCLVIGAAAPIALWAFAPMTIPAGFIAALLVIAVVRGRKNRKRLGLLRWGKVATVTNGDELSRGTYYGGMTYNNMIVPQAHGWDVTRRWYSGPGSVTKIEYSLDGVAGSFTLRGLPYAGGVVLAHSRKPSVALCVSSFPYSVKPGPDGELVGRLAVKTWVGVVATLLIEGALVAGAVYSALALW